MAEKRPKAVLSWSSGKDSAYALHKVLEEGRYEVVGLLTTVTETFKRVAMHGVREAILEEQAQQTRLVLDKVLIPSRCPNEVYEARIGAAIKRWKSKGVSHFIFGDLFLEDIRAYREKQLGSVGLKGVYPLWGINTRDLAKNMIKDGLKAVLACVDLKKLPKEYAGRQFDSMLLEDLPPGTDPCGENGEFHTCVYAGPMFRNPIPVSVGDIVVREGFAFADILPDSVAV